MSQLIDGRVTGRTCRVSCLSMTAFLVVALVGSGCSQTSSTPVQIRALSNQPDMVSGGDVLIRLEVPEGMATSDVQVMLEGADVTAGFRADEGGRSITGLVTGLAEGQNTLTATVGSGEPAELMLRNHPITGPIFAGPKEQPFICETESFNLQGGGALGPALDADCSVATRVDYVYRATDSDDLLALPDSGTRPADVAMVTVAGNEVPYIVRIETGTINRAIYQIAILHDAASEAEPDFATPPTGWNRRLIYTFGGGCEPGLYRQGASTGGVVDDEHLRRGFAVASASLDVGGTNCYDDVLSAETMMMVKERFIEAYGVPLYTMGWGNSAGSIQQQLISQNYPGLLDGLVLARSFADGQFASSTPSGEARLIKHYFDERASVHFTDDQKSEIAGFGSLATLNNLGQRAARFNATERCPDGLSPDQRYDPATNPGGTRCTMWDHAANVYGRDPETGFARRPLDNVGIQYGLTVLNRGDISTEQFLDLNEHIGGFDIDGNLVAERMVADLAATRAAYQGGRVGSGGGALSTVPIVDYRPYYDDAPRGDVHLIFQSFTTRARLQNANGHVDNRVMLVEDRRYGAFSTASPVVREALDQMDQWLTALAADASADSAIAKVRRARPAELVDACWTPGETPEKIVEEQQYQSGRCHELYPAHSFPRGVAGAPIEGDIIKCQLKPVDPADYAVTFEASEMARLQQIFPDGTCDWSKPGVEQQPIAGTWQTYGQEN